MLGRIFAQHPKRYLLNADTPLGHDTSANHSSPRILELGAGTGVMSILCRLLLDHLSKDQQPRATGVYGHVLATDYHPLVLDNLQRCIDLNFKEGYDPEQAGLSCEQAQQDPVSQKPERQGRDTGVQGLEALLLDWREFPAIVQQWQQEETRGKDVTARRLEPSAPLSDGIWTLPAASTFDPAGENLVTPCMRSLLQDPWDMIIAADCVYDLAHAGMIRDVVKWCLRVPEMDTSGKVIREGGVLVCLILISIHSLVSPLLTSFFLAHPLTPHSICSVLFDRHMQRKQRPSCVPFHPRQAFRLGLKEPPPPQSCETSSI